MAEHEEEAPPRALTWEEIQDILSNDSNGEAPAPDICRLYRAIFCLRQAAPSKPEAVASLEAALRNRHGGPGGEGGIRFKSVLFRHECCYLLGQIGADCEDQVGRQAAYDCLMEVLLDETEDEVTRHEAAEGIAAVHGAGTTSSTDGQDDAQGLLSSEVFKTLERLALESGGRGPLGETCHLAVEGMRRHGATRVCACQYASHDPALGDPSAQAADLPRYTNMLEDESVELFQRYVAMFTLRNLGAGEVLAQALDADQSSAVLRHELAFVLGQLENEVAVTALTRSLGKVQEHAMVRHEAAIALGSIGGEISKRALREFSSDKEPMVAESCLVALDTVAYWEAWERLEERMRREG